MPSYIEIDQNVTFPSSSGAGKVILGVNANNQVTVTDNVGSTSAVGGPLYKVYTALLTQSGGDDPLGDNGGTAVGNYPELVIGRTYYIADNFQLECDFTNVGAPNNNVGTYFVATGTTPASWGTYGLLQYNTGAPVVTVLENTIGNIWFEYMTVGYYHVRSGGLFTLGKSSIVLGGPTWDGGGNGYFSYGFDGNDTALITNRNFLNNFVNNGSILNTFLEIRVYN